MTWEDGFNPQLAYTVSKLFAEKAANKFVEDEKPNFDLVVFNPCVTHLSFSRICSRIPPDRGSLDLS